MADEQIQKVETKVEVDGETVEIAPGAVTSVTTEVPHEADSTSAPNALPDDVNRPPVSTNDPEQPIAHSLIAGAGAPTPEPEIHPETHVASNAYVTDADREAGNVQTMNVDDEGRPTGGFSADAGSADEPKSRRRRAPDSEPSDA